MARSKKDSPAITFVPNPTIAGRAGHYKTVTVSIPKIIESWRASLFAFEWMLPDGRIKTRDELSANEQPKRDAVEAQIAKGAALETPVLGIGLLENVEIGTGRAVVLTLAAHGVATMPAHIPASHEDEFAPFIA